MPYGNPSYKHYNRGGIKGIDDGFQQPEAGADDDNNRHDIRRSIGKGLLFEKQLKGNKFDNFFRQCEHNKSINRFV